MPIADLLRTGQDAFVANHADQKAAADRVYVTTWATAFFLMFERRQIGTAEVRCLSSNSREERRLAAAFREWVGSDVNQFDGELRSYLERLRADGTTR